MSNEVASIFPLERHGQYLGDVPRTRRVRIPLITRTRLPKIPTSPGEHHPSAYLASAAERRECTVSGRYIYLRKSRFAKSSKVSRVQ